MADQMTTVGIPTDAESGDVKVETETRPEDAPWGYKKDGTPYKVDPTRYERRDAKRRGARAPTSKAKAPKRSVYAETVSDLMMLVAGPLAIAGIRNDAFLADACMVEMSAESVGEAFGKLAEQNQNVARMLDKLGEVGPYGLVFAAMAPIFAQGLVNHGMIPAGFMGTAEPKDLIEARLGQADDTGGMAA